MIAQAIKMYKENQASEVKEACKLCKKFKDILKVYSTYNNKILREQIHAVTRLIKTLRTDYGYVPDRVLTVCARLSEKLNKEVFNTYIREYKSLNNPNQFKNEPKRRSQVNRIFKLLTIRIMKDRSIFLVIFAIFIFSISAFSKTVSEIPRTKRPFSAVGYATESTESSESNKSNNTVNVPLVVTEPQPTDLIISFITLPSVSLPVNSTVSAVINILNIGANASNVNSVDLFLSTDQTLDAGDLSLGSGAIPILDPGISSDVFINFFIPETLALGDYFLIAEVDSYNVNNQKVRSVKVVEEVVVIEDDVIISNLTVYPNPFYDFITIKLDNEGFGEIFINLYDINGKLFSSKILNKSTVEMEIQISTMNLPGNIYILEARNHKFRSSQRVIKR